MEENKHKTEEKKDHVSEKKEVTHSHAHENKELNDGLKKSTNVGLKDGLSKENISETKKDEAKDEKKDSVVKKEVHKIKKKEEAVAYGDNMHISKRHGQYICAFIKNKKIDDAIISLGRVTKLRLAIPYKGEVPHRKGMMSGRYPVKAAGFFIKLLKGLRGNVIVNGMDLDNTIIFDANSNWATRPRKSDNRKAKRSNVIIIARERSAKK